MVCGHGCSSNDTKSNKVEVPFHGSVSVVDEVGEKKDGGDPAADGADGQRPEADADGAEKPEG